MSNVKCTVTHTHQSRVDRDEAQRTPVGSAVCSISRVDRSVDLYPRGKSPNHNNSAFLGVGNRHRRSSHNDRTSKVGLRRTLYGQWQQGTLTQFPLCSARPVGMSNLAAISDMHTYTLVCGICGGVQFAPSNTKSVPACSSSVSALSRKSRHRRSAQEIFF